jgi:hypothetical protein
MARLRIGPLSYGPKGRRGLHLGPLNMSYNTRNPAFGAFMLLVIVVALVKTLWPYLLLFGVVFLTAWLLTKEKREEQAAAAKQRQVQEIQQWLKGAPPPLPLPARFTDNWFAANVPKLHPGQVSVLLDEMHARGWTTRRIEQRVGPHLQRNPFYTGQRLP